MLIPDLLPDQQTVLKHRRAFVLILLLVLLASLVYVLRTILLGALAGVLLWVMSRGVYERALRRLKGRQGAAAGLSIVFVLLVVIIPLLVVVVLMTIDAAALAAGAQQWLGPYEQRIKETFEQFTDGRSVYVFDYEITSEEVRQKFTEVASQAGQFLMGLVQKTVSGVVQMVLAILIALYTLYFFYIDGHKMVEWFRSRLPLMPEHSKDLLDTFFLTSITTLKMVGIIGLVQGAGAGLAYWLLGVPAPLFLTCLTAIASVIPSVGTGLVIAPVTIGLFLAGETWKAVVLGIWGAIAIGNIDNILRPYLVHKTLKMHQLVIFLSMVGGIATFGFLGVLIGPVLAAMFNTALNIYLDVFQRSAPPDMAD